MVTDFNNNITRMNYIIWTNVVNNTVENISIETLIWFTNYINHNNGGSSYRYITHELSRILNTHYNVHDRVQTNTIINTIITIINTINTNNIFIHNKIIFIIYYMITSNNNYTNIRSKTIHDIVNILNNNNNSLHPNTYVFIYILLIFSYNERNTTNANNDIGVDVLDGLYSEIDNNINRLNYMDNNTNMLNNDLRNNNIYNNYNAVLNVNNINNYNNNYNHNYYNNNNTITITDYNYNNNNTIAITDLIKCPFCRNQCSRDRWVQTTELGTCDVCFEDEQIMCKSIECDHSLCVVCTNNIKCV